MEENKGALKRIQQILLKIFKGKKYKELPVIVENEINDNREEKNEFKERVAVNIEKNIDKHEPEDISIDEMDIINKFSFPANLQGFTFKTNIVFDENSPKGSYVCSLENYDEKSIENSLPICKTLSQRKARIVENTLLGLKAIIDEDYSKDLIKTIIEKGFRLENNENERFNVTEDYHLSDVLQKILDAKQKDENIEIPVNYLYKLNELNTKGYKIIKSNRLIEIEEKQKKEQEEEEKIKSINFDDIIKKYIVQGEPIDFNNMDESQIQILKEHYINMINNIKEKNAIDEYIQFGLEYIMNSARTNPRYAQILNTYEEVEANFKKYTNNTLKQLDLKKQQQTLKEIIVNNYLFNELQNKFNIFNELEKDENIR